MISSSMKMAMGDPIDMGNDLGSVASMVMVSVPLIEGAGRRWRRKMSSLGHVMIVIPSLITMDRMVVRQFLGFEL